MRSLRSFLFDILALIAIFEAVLLFHPILAFSDSALTDYDLFTYFYPFWQYRADAFNLGSLPLWNPYTFTGVPFLANIQTGVLYLPNLLFVNFDPPRAAALSYIAHLFWAGAGMYFLLKQGFRSGHVGALGAAIIFALGGFLGAQAGHINQVQAACWLPFLALATIQACRRLSITWALAGAVGLGMQITAGHPQELYLSSVAIGILAVYEVVRQGFVSAAIGNHRFHPVIRPPAFLSHLVIHAGLSGAMFVLLIGLGVGLAAFQLLPTIELTNGNSLRSGGLPYVLASSFSLPPFEILTAFLPTFTDPPFSEFNAYVGIVGLGLAWIGISNWRRSTYAPYLAGIAVLGLFLAFGGYNPLYRFFYDIIPGLNLFRVPARWLFLPAFGLAGLAGLGLDALWRQPRKRAEIRTLGYDVASVFPPLLWGMLLFALMATILTPPPFEAIVSWVRGGLAVLVLALIGPFIVRGAFVAVLLVGLVTFELWAARAPLPISHPVPAEAYRDLRPAVAQLLQDQSLYRVLNIANPRYEPGDLKEMRQMLAPLLSPADADNYIIATKYKETLNPNMGLRYGIASLDGYDGGLLPLKDFAALKAMLVSTADSKPPPASSTSAAAELIRDEVFGMPDISLLSKLNVKYIVADRLYDAWDNGAYIDLGTAQTIRQGQTFSLNAPSSDVATTVLLATYLEAYSGMEPGKLIANVTVTDSVGRNYSFPLRVYVETAPANIDLKTYTLPEKMVPDARLVPLNTASMLGMRRGHPDDRISLVRLNIGQFQPRSIRIDNVSTTDILTLSGVAFVDSRTQTSFSPPLDPRLRRLFTGDVKIYENLSVQPRAYFATKVWPLQNQTAQLALYQQLGPNDVALVEDPLSLGANPPPTTNPPAQVNIDSYAGDRITASVIAQSPGYFVLTDNFYPGWRASVDGEETPILRANGVFRAIPLQSGEHHIEFRFQPESLAQGWKLTQVSAYTIILLLVGDVLAVIGLATARRWRRAKARTAERKAQREAEAPAVQQLPGPPYDPEASATESAVQPSTPPRDSEASANEPTQPPIPDRPPGNGPS